MEQVKYDDMVCKTIIISMIIENSHQLQYALGTWANYYVGVYTVYVECKKSSLSSVDNNI